jgi:hypothetical protein
MNIVTPGEMQRVDIQPGWVLRQIGKFVLGFDEETDRIDTCDIHQLHDLIEDQLNPEFYDALLEYDNLVFQKNQQYKDAWQQDGPVTALTDLKDKLYRLDSASESGAVLKWNTDKLRGTFFDILVRDIMCMAWFGLNFVDDDDDRQEQ